MSRYFKLTGLVIFIFLTAVVKGQQINTLRSLDNNKAISEDTTDWKIHRIIKDINLNKVRENPSISFGGEIREQLRVYQNISFGDVKTGARDHDIFIWQRYFFHADLRLNKNLRIFGQLNSNQVNFKDNVSPETEHDDLGILQGFIDLQMNLPMVVQVRLGRQEFSFGAERMMGLRDGPNIRQTFDGARITTKLKKATGDFLIAQPVSYQPGIFDNLRNKAVTVYSTYWAIPVTKKSTLDLYYFGHRIEGLKFAGDTATENRHSFGLRFSNSTSPFYYDAEAIFQFGKFGDNRISAWQISSIVGYRWNGVALKPRVQVREGVISGDRVADDGIINTFRPISARPPVNDLLPAGPANIVIVTPEAEITVHKGLTLILRYMAIWRLTGTDGMYSGDVKTLTRQADNGTTVYGNSIATGIVTDIAYIINQHFNVGFTGGHFFAGNYVINTGKGENNSACSFRVTYKF